MSSVFSEARFISEVHFELILNRFGGASFSPERDLRRHKFESFIIIPGECWSNSSKDEMGEIERLSERPESLEGFLISIGEGGLTKIGTFPLNKIVTLVS